jgi:hypothetical protein
MLQNHCLQQAFYLPYRFRTKKARAAIGRAFGETKKKRLGSIVTIRHSAKRQRRFPRSSVRPALPSGSGRNPPFLLELFELELVLGFGRHSLEVNHHDENPFRSFLAF